MTNNEKEQESQFLVRWYNGSKPTVYGPYELSKLRKGTGGNGYVYFNPNGGPNKQGAYEKALDILPVKGLKDRKKRIER
jgi:hypothetical protein